MEWFDTDVRDWESYPGWYQPEGCPYASFLTLRITAEGEILMPYIKNTVVGERVLRETSVLYEGDAVGVEGGSDRPPAEGVTVAPGPSADYAAGQSPDRQSRESSAAVQGGTFAALTASRPARNSPNFSQLTFFGLSNSPVPPGAQSPQRSRAPDDP